MPRDILSGFGADADKPMAAPAAHGGIMPVKQIPYATPTGPIGVNHPSGRGNLGGANLGNCGSQGRYDVTGDGGAGRPGDLNTERPKNEGTQRG